MEIEIKNTKNDFEKLISELRKDLATKDEQIATVISEVIYLILFVTDKLLSTYHFTLKVFANNIICILGTFTFYTKLNFYTCRINFCNNT